MAALKVAGACPKCQTPVETEAPKGRATWRGDCPKDGCDGRIVATRIKPTAAPKAPPADPAVPEGAKPVTTPPQPTPTRGRRVVKVAGYDRTVPARAGAPGAAAVPRTPKPPGRPAPAGSKPDTPAGAGPEPGPAVPVRSERTEDGRHHGHPAGRYGFDLW